MSIMREGSTSTSLPRDVNVAWNSTFKQRIKESPVSIYDKGCVVEVPFGDTLEKRLDNLFSLSEKVKETSEAHPSKGEEFVYLGNLVQTAIDDCITTEGFDYQTAYEVLGGILEEIKKSALVSLEAAQGGGLKKAVNAITSKHTCHYCGYPIPKYPGAEIYRCPSCGNYVKLVFDGETEAIIVKKATKYPTPADISENLSNIRLEVKKRSALFRNITKMSEGKLDRLEALKATLSCLTRVVVEEQQNADKGILPAVGEPLIMDIVSLFLGEGVKEVQERVGNYFMPGRAKEPTASVPGGNISLPVPDSEEEEEKKKKKKKRGG